MAEQELRDAARAGNLAKCKEIVKKNSKMNVNECDSSGWCPLSYATYFRHIDLVRYFLSEKKFDVNPTHTGSFLTTPVYLTCQIGDIELMNVFLEDPRTAWKQARDYGETPISILKQNGFKEQLEVMRKFSLISSFLFLLLFLLFFVLFSKFIFFIIFSTILNDK